MPRLKSSVRISIKLKGKLIKLELIKQPFGKKFWLRVDGKNSEKLPEATATTVSNRIRLILKGIK